MRQAFKIGNVLSFFRYGHFEGTSIGNPALIDRMVTGGMAIENIFGQDNDVIDMGASWAGGTSAVSPCSSPFPSSPTLERNSSISVTR